MINLVLYMIERRIFMKTFLAIIGETIIGQAVAGIVSTVIKTNLFNKYIKKIGKELNRLKKEVERRRYKQRFNTDDYVDGEYRVI